ncbi:MAG: metallophosphoesterase family protein [Bacteroidia bacterium]
MKKIGILSDIHSNCFALKSVLDDLHAEGIEHLIVLGDIFGYYPWAAETFRLLQPFLQESWFIRGNHDQLLLDSSPPSPIPVYWDAAKQNERELIQNYPEALPWLKSLPDFLELKIGNTKLKAFHGTPADSLNGRFYPDHHTKESWFPEQGKLLLLGHTHYPLLSSPVVNKGIIFNPGSVGQPRDANPMPSWGILDTETCMLELKRSAYDQHKAMDLLVQMNWNKRAILALNKTDKGSLKE